MPRSRRSGLNVARKTRADGSTVEYFYDRQTGQFLGHDRAAAEARVKGVEEPKAPDTIAGLIERYKASQAFRTRAPGTQELYSRYLDQIKQGWGDQPVSAIRSSTIETIKDRLQDQPSKCNMILALFRILLRLAVRLEYVQNNVASRPGRMAVKSRTEVWTLQDEQRFMAVSRPSLKLAFMLLLYTLQRPSDVLEMSASRVSEQNGRLFIAVKQAKTGALLDIPVHRNLAPLLRQRIAEAGPDDRLVASPRGFVWSRRNFSRAWDHDMDLASLDGVQRRDLRRTGIVRMAESGASVGLISQVSGHSTDYCQRIMDTYMPRRTELAIAGIEMWERHEHKDYSKVVQLAVQKGSKK